MLVGHSCEFGSECNFHHITYDEYQNVLEPFERNQLQAWILSKSEDLEVLPSLGLPIVEAEEADGDEDALGPAIVEAQEADVEADEASA
jgi:hypothetical protein